MDSSPANIRTRSYQQEMFERSMEGNTIVVMDTGSGKTHVAVLRIQAELDRCPREQRVWFLAPTVELCNQQHSKLSVALPAYNHRLLTGMDSVDRWSEQRIWDAALDQCRIIVSTHAVLADALQHGFVRISSLALLIFDEAHHCVKKHPANVIMKDFYCPAKAAHGSSAVPHILGLSASLITKSSLVTLHTIEKNLDSISVTPRIHREELMRYVYRPNCQLLEFDSLSDQDSQVASKGFSELKALRDSLILAHVTQQMSFDEAVNTTKRSSAGMTADTAQPHQDLNMIHAFCKKAEVVNQSLGSWAADYFIGETIRMLENGHEGMQNLFEAKATRGQSLLALLGQSPLRARCHDYLDPMDDTISPKVKRLISFLLEDTTEEPVGIVFVEQRATTCVLAALLCRHSATKERFRCMPFVGTSNSPNRKSGLTELVNLKAQRDTVGKFRVGEHNLVIATNALEEGIDVQSCNLVACFDPPANIKSFIQRRGRARHMRSRLSILQPSVGDRSMLDRWHSLENELSRICQSDRERMISASNAEDLDEEMDYELTVLSTGAKLNADRTLGHLHHFCNKLPHRPYVDFRPTFSYHEDESGFIEATVVLPNSVSAQVRRANSEKRWLTERAAQKDAAFQAYAALYRAALLNDHLLPLSSNWPVEHDDMEEKCLRKTRISPQMDIWSEVPVEKMSSTWHETVLTVVPADDLREDGETDVRMILTTPARLLPVLSLFLELVSQQFVTVKFGRSVQVLLSQSDDIKRLRETTLLFYTSVRSERLACHNTEFVTLFSPYLKHESLPEWLQRNSQRIRASRIVGTLPNFLVRVPYPNKPAYIFRGWGTSEDGDTVQCEPLPRRRNFLPYTRLKASAFPQTSSSLRREPRWETFAAGSCTFDSLPLHMARIGLFMPAILQHLGDFTIVDRLQSSLLKRVRFQHRKNILTAICAPSALRQTNYQRFEFLGDTLLKYVVACHLFISKPDWHEGFLTLKMSQLVCNTTLARAAVSTGLASYIITEDMSHRDWTVPVFPPASHAREHRYVSPKLLADVVEALVGAAWVDSGIESARECISTFLPVIPSRQADFSNVVVPDGIEFGNAADVECLVGYTFNRPILLLEALTHPSCGGHSRTDSYQRLEFLGDAVLDMIIARRLATKLDRISQGRMTQLKSALVNARLLGFLCLDLHQRVTHRAVRADVKGLITETTSTREVHLVTFMRSASPELLVAQHASQERYTLHRAGIRQKLDSGRVYPWMELLRLRLDKFYSDIIESILGSIFLDAHGSLLPCEHFIEKLGVFAYMDRLIDEEVDASHPRERVQRCVGAGNVTYEIQRSDVDGRFRCRILIDNVEIAEANGYVDREEAILEVAIRAEEALSSRESRKASEV